MKYPKAFGARPDHTKQVLYQRSAHYRDGKFHNLVDRYSILIQKDFVDDSIHKQGRRPNKKIVTRKLNTDFFDLNQRSFQCVWFGHSSLLFRVNGKTIFVDPMFSAVPSPFQAIGRKRFNADFPVDLDALPAIDLCLITHDHYDHLDYHSILQMKDKVVHFVVPLGVSAHLNRWGVKEENITELDWFEAYQTEFINCRLTPSHHYSGRSLNDRFASLWGGWILESNDQKIYISGDGGLNPHFQQIGNDYGPFDLAFIECGQYSRYWQHNHLFPEQSAIVADLVGAKFAIPIHWATLSLAMHRWSDPVSRFNTAMKAQKAVALNPEIGQVIDLGCINQEDFCQWWKAYES